MEAVISEFEEDGCNQQDWVGILLSARPKWRLLSARLNLMAVISETEMEAAISETEVYGCDQRD
jgi:hypothetical protein